MSLFFIAIVCGLALSSVAQQVEVTDVWGRRLNERGITLVDWDGFLANPAIKLTLRVPGAEILPIDTTITATHPRIYFDHTLSLTNSVSRTIHISIFPDRDGEDEQYELRITSTKTTTTIPIRVIDLDRPAAKHFPVTLDFSKDKTGFFKNPDARRITQQAADDWAFFIDDMKFKTIPVGAEKTWIWNPDGFHSGQLVKNDRPFDGYLLYAYGVHHAELRSGGEGSYVGALYQNDGLRRSGGFEAETAGNYNALGWFFTTSDDDWNRSGNLRHETNDFYSIAHHEIGHALFFNSHHPAFARWKKETKLSSPEVIAYLGHPAQINSSDHFPGEVDPASLKGAFGNEYGGVMARKRWVPTKLDLLCLASLGYKLRPIFAFAPFKVDSSQFDPKARLNAPYSSALHPTASIPIFSFNISAGALPPGLSLDTFTGTISGTPTQTGAFQFQIEAQEFSTNSPAIQIPLTLNVGTD